MFDLDVSKRTLLMNAINLLIWQGVFPTSTSYAFERGFRSGDEFVYSGLGPWWVLLWVVSPATGQPVGKVQYLRPAELIQAAGKPSTVRGVNEPS